MLWDYGNCLLFAFVLKSHLMHSKGRRSVCVMQCRRACERARNTRRHSLQVNIVTSRRPRRWLPPVALCSCSILWLWNRMTGRMKIKYMRWYDVSFFLQQSSDPRNSSQHSLQPRNQLYPARPWTRADDQQVDLRQGHLSMAFTHSKRDTGR